MLLSKRRTDQSLLQSVEYINTADEPNPVTRSFTLQVFDADFASDISTMRIDVELINDQLPVLDLDTTKAGIDFHTYFTEEGPSIPIINKQFLLSDADSGYLYQYPTLIRGSGLLPTYRHRAVLPGVRIFSRVGS